MNRAEICQVGNKFKLYRFLGYVSFILFLKSVKNVCLEPLLKQRDVSDRKEN